LSYGTESDRPTPVTVQILDKEYRIACSPEEQYGLMDCARLLDQRMREVRQNGRVIGADRIAVMASLNLLYELMLERDQATRNLGRLGQVQQRLGQALTLAEPAPGNARQRTGPKGGSPARPKAGSATDASPVPGAGAIGTGDGSPVAPGTDDDSPRNPQNGLDAADESV
jgi:cell division protein ZapA